MPEGLPKIQDNAPKVTIPSGGLKVGLFKNDLTQLMSADDADLVRRRLPINQRSGPGALPLAVCGLLVGCMWPLLADGTLFDASIGAVVGAVATSVLFVTATRLGMFNRQAIKAATAAIQRARKDT